MLIKQEDNRTPPGFAVVVHHKPPQLFAMFVCRSVRAKLDRPQLLTHAYQQPASDVQVHHQQPACTSTKPAQLNAAHVLAVSIKFHGYEKEEKDVHMFQ
jgi:hypothetical protein